MPGQLLLYLVLANASRILAVIALARAQVPTLAPLGYAGIVFAALLQWIAFGQRIALVEAMALALILGAGLGVAFLRSRPGTPPAPVPAPVPAPARPLADMTPTAVRSAPCHLLGLPL